jgi:hypothetical protein
MGKRLVLESETLLGENPALANKSFTLLEIY